MVKLTGSKALFEALKAEGVKHIFGIPGGAVIPIYDALYDVHEIRHILTRHEQGAAHAADGYARALGKQGVCMTTSGPGATNLTTGILNAYMDSSPVVAISGQVSTQSLGTDAFQEADMLSVMLPITKHNFIIHRAEELPSVVKLAFKIAITGRPGPVHIDVPKSVQVSKADFKIPAKIKYEKSPKLEPEAGQIKKAVDMLTKAEQPVIYAGGGVIWSSASAEVVKLAEMLGAPVTTSLLGKGLIPEDHPLALGMLGMHGRMAANLAVTESDVLLAVGARFSDRSTGDVSSFAPKAKIIHIDIDPVEIGKNVRVDLPIIGDAKRALTAIIKGLRSHARRGRTSKWIRRVKKLRKDLAPRMDYDEIPIKPQRVIKEIMSVLDENAIIVTEVGQCQMWTAHFYMVRKPRHFISSGGLGTMGFGFPAAMGVKVARPKCDVVNIAGDGSFLMNSQELATVVENKINVVSCIFNNRYLGMVKQWQDMFFQKRRSATCLGKVPNFVKLAEAYNAWGDRATRPSEVAPKLREALRCGKPAVLDIPIDPDEHVLPMVPAGGRIDQMLT
ncbi:MAG: biosynthetic-type acetolactate synthase large subunit [Candidatus Hadarchaeaceae archaeon]|nr:biosynthetic-type acetolactate synthase large subunit [Hadesarchaea archaeon]MDH5685313.1 biosynthetic-type acetolactate synthase large subunit [Hadesarchaea archaeon]